MPNENQCYDSVSRRKYLTAVGAATATLAGCIGSDGGGGGGSGSDTYHFGFSIKNMNNPWLQVFRRIGKLYAQSLGHRMTVTQAGGNAQTQIQNVRSMLNSDIDGLMISPYSSSSTIGVIESAVDQGVPVYTTNSSAPTEAVSMFTGFGSFNAGYRIGQKMITALKKTYGGSRVIDLVGDQADQSAIRRSRGFRKAIKEANGITVARVIYNKNWSQQAATQNLSAFLQSDKNIHGIYSVWGGGALAAVNVLRKMGMLTTRDDTKNYIPIMNIDGFPSVIDNIKKGYIHTTLQQPMPFYAPISLEYMIHHLNTGSATIPKPGSQVKTGSSSNFPNRIATKNFSHNGVKPLSTPYWAPAQVINWQLEGTTYYPWLKPKTVAITKKNADANYLWGNYTGKIQ